MKTKKLSVLFFVMVSFTCILGQINQFKIQGHLFAIKDKKLNNEWKTKDDARDLYRIENGKEKLLLTFFAFKDEGGDCNNVFWDEEILKIEGNKIIITTHHLQNLSDPITEWEKKIYHVSKKGKVELTEHLFKKFGSNIWKTKEEWYDK